MGLFARQIVGIDLGHASVKVVGIVAGKNPTITGFAEVPVDAKYLQKDNPDTTVVAEAIREAMKTAVPHPIRAKEAYITVSEEAIFRKILEVPEDISLADLPQVVRTQAVEYLPDDIETLEIDYQVLSTEPKCPKQVMLVAVSKQLVEHYLGITKEAKLRVLGIDPKPSAVGRAVVLPTDKEPVLLVDVGSQSSSISVYAEQMIWVTGTVNMGGDIIKDLATGKPDEERKAEKLKQLANGLADEIDHVVKFYANRASQEGDIKELRLCGGGSMIEGLDKLLGEEVRQKVVIGKPIVDLPEGCDRRFLGALGSALYPMYDLL
jgi:type IV pilus assembly protein PilM